MSAAALAAVSMASAASAQELKFQFINPSFGGNPFNSDHLLAIATAQRPDKPASEDGTTGELTEAQLFARQIQSRLLSALSSSVVEAITGSNPGTTGEFTVGDQKISFERTLSEIKLTIFDNTTGENTVISVPVLNFSNSAASAALSANTSAESSLLGSTLTGTSSVEGSLLTSLTGQ
ncbi:curli assembly protein CsgF [Novosphingobium sp. JCM 18896]|uniref:curli assembly protein CsgF n=1 Tax=Novosphingobium sp. JCM 18896 TaxID=2989731 RepID=UPI002222A201|nr:curli assembly protein CsgF [Novosphingobium sp. JCM 18896]MCW1431590.1 curli assembly protein CsgF [Novosphingobium sp. JCM 18896]